MTAFFGTVAARLGAALAMLLRVPGAFFGTSITNFGTDAANLVDEP
jgi:hypothetical protein